MEKVFSFTGKQIFDEIVTKRNEIVALEEALIKLHPVANGTSIEACLEDWSKDPREAVKLVYNAYKSKAEELQMLFNNDYRATCQIR